MDIPLLVLEELDYTLAKKYYPTLNIQKKEFQDLNPDYLIANYDVSFMSDLWEQEIIKKKFSELEKKYNKVWRNVHCPHGFSDKGFYLKKCARRYHIALWPKYDRSVEIFRCMARYQTLCDHRQLPLYFFQTK